MNKRLIGILLAVLFAFAPAAMAADIPLPTEDAYVYDGADVLDRETEGVIVFANDLLYEETGAQIAVVTVDTTGDVAIADYALQLFNEWGIGDAKKQNGFLLLLAIEDEDYYALPGTGLDLELSGGALSRMFDEYLEKDFAAGNYSDGVFKFFSAVYGKIADICGSDLTVQDGVEAFEKYNDREVSRDVPGVNSGSHIGSVFSGIGKLIRTVGMIIVIVVAVVAIVTLLKVTRRPIGRSHTHVHFIPIIRPRVHRPHHGPGFFGGTGPRPGGSQHSGFRSFGGGRSSSFGGGRSSGGSRGGFGGGRSFGGGGSRGGGAGRGRR